MKFKVEICRTSYAYTTIEVEADKGTRAAEIAEQKAGDLEYTEKNAEYEVTGTEYVSGAETNGYIWANAANQKVIGRGQDARGPFLVLDCETYGTNMYHRGYSGFHGSNLAKFDLYVNDPNVPFWGPQPNAQVDAP